MTYLTTEIMSPVRSKILPAHIQNHMDLEDKLRRTECLNDPIRCEILMLIGEHFSLTFEELLQHLKTVQPTVLPEELEKELELMGDYVLKTQDKKLTTDPNPDLRWCTGSHNMGIDGDAVDCLAEKIEEKLGGTLTREAHDTLEPVEKYVLTEDGRDTLDEMLTSKYYSKRLPKRGLSKNE
jgi:hypothetical protein